MSVEPESVLAEKLGNGLELRMGTSKLSWEDFPEPREAVVIGQGAFWTAKFGLAEVMESTG